MKLAILLLYSIILMVFSAMFIENNYILSVVISFILIVNAIILRRGRK